MTKTKKKKSRPHIRSHDPYRRRDELEIIKIVTEIQSGIIGIRASCKKHGMCRPTLQKWMRRLSVRNLGDELSTQLLANMTEDKKSQLLETKVKELAKALDHAKLKIASLETLIKVVEENLHIKIRKKRGTKQSKE